MTSAPSTSTSPSRTRTHRATSRRPDVVTGVLAALGGGAWVAAALTHAARPEGCVGDTCAGTPMREATTTTALLVVLAAALMLASGVGLLLAVRRTGRMGRTGVAGAGLCAAGALTLTVAVILQETVADGDFEWMPWFVGPGVVALAIGIALVGWTLLRSPAVPRWAGALLIAGAALMVLSNEQTRAVLLVIPFGLAWAATGIALALRSDTGGKSRIDVR